MWSSYSPGTGASSLPSLMADVTKTWSFQTTGELQLNPSIGVVHRTLCVLLHVSGSALLSATTPASGPRNRGHCSLADTHAARTAKATLVRTGARPRIASLRT